MSRSGPGNGAARTLSGDEAFHGAGEEIGSANFGWSVALSFTASTAQIGGASRQQQCRGDAGARQLQPSPSRARRPSQG